MTDKHDYEGMGFMTRAIHLGYDAQEAHGAVNAPLYMTSTYSFDTMAEAEAVFAGESERYVYGRQHNPTQALLEKRLASLDGAEAALVTGTGMGAICSTMMTLLQAGDEIISHHTIYSTASSYLDDGLPGLGIGVRKVDLMNPAEFAAAVTDKTRLVYFESPVNPSGEVLDIRAISDRARAAGLLVVIDSTFASPALQQPLSLGIDLVIHSLTKYINGHGDTLGGAVIGNAETIDRIRGKGMRYMTGSSLSPMSCFLVLRGLKTLKIRMRQHGESALRIARLLDQHAAVSTVCYPFLPTHAQYELARRQMSAGSGMLSFELKSGFEGATKLLDGLELIAKAVSLGDTETLITHPATLVEARQRIVPSAKLARGVSRSMIRLSVGLEEVEDIWADLERSLDRLV
ncbi:trans-sulfuration enzyme family protein [Paraburkholderia hospita]|uniref:trans-sulfuration enzyme family protein n=1 Tax=Paraburkholderia hospita TaxID=169430 RepID=UPI000DEED67F|nr:PLP-dependent aspartate aminotransferase family protein [Paraburkholderia hospita]AXF05908.1 methionine gamma-lyase [Paraburkholderia hospita]